MTYEIETVINSDFFGITDDKEMEGMENVKSIQKKEKSYGVCFHYALQDDSLDDCKEAFDELLYSYKQINIKKARKGDIISYHEINNFNSKYEKPCCGNALHFAIIKETKGTLKSTTILSKWGEYDVYESSLFDVLDIYGNAIVIWRKEKL